MESTYISTGYKIGKRQPLDFLKLGMLLIITCQLCTYLLLTMFNSRLATFVAISVEHDWFSLLIRCNSDPESLKHDMSLMKVYIYINKCLTTSNFLATPLLLHWFTTSEPQLGIWNLGLESGIFAKKPWDSESCTEIWLVLGPSNRIFLRCRFPDSIRIHLAIYRIASAKFKRGDIDELAVLTGKILTDILY